MSGTETQVGFKLRLDGDKAVTAGLDGISKSFAVSADAALKLEKATASVAVAQAKVDQAINRSAAAQAAYNAAVKSGKASQEEMARLSQASAQAMANQAAALVALKDKAQGLKALENAHAGVAAQTKLTGNQTAQLSAQLQDLFVQIQAGGSPMTALIQQGSQLSAVFGGTRPALAAVASIFSPLVVGLGAAAAGVAALTIAYTQGHDEVESYAKALILSGNAAGETVGMLNESAKAMDRVAGTQGKAAEVISQLVASGVIAAPQIDKITESVIRMERAGGPAADALIKQFNDLGKSPADAVLKINEATNFLTSSIYKQIKALEEQGKTAEAAAVAQTAYANAMTERSKALEVRLGALQRVWRGITDTAKKAWDAMLGIGRQKTLEEQFADAQRQLDAAQAPRNGGNNLQAEERRNAIKQRMEDLRLQILTEREAAATQEASAEGVKKYAKNYDDMQAAAKRAADAHKKLIEDGKKLAADMLDQSGGLNSDFAEKWNSLGVAYKAGAISLEKLTKAQAVLLTQQPAMKSAAEADEKAAEAMAKAYIDAGAAVLDAATKIGEAAQLSLAAAIGRTRSLEDEATALALSKTANISLAEAVERVGLARLREQLDAANASGNTTQINAIKAEIAVRERLINLVANKDTAARDAKAIEEATKTLDAFFAPDRAKSFAEVIGEAFNKAGGAVGKMGQALQSYGTQMQAIQKAQAAASQLDNPVQKWIAEQEIAKKSATTQIGLYADMAGAAKGFFSEGSRGYKTLQAAETAFRAYQLASDLVQGASAAAVAIARQANGDPYTAWARMAAMAAAMAALGFAVSGGFNSSSSAPSAADRQAATGTGTVLGDSTAKSDSVAKAIEALSSTARIELTVQSGMLASLRNIEASMAGLGNLVLQANGLTTGKNLGIQTGKISSNVGDPVLNALGLDDFARNLPVIGGVVSKLQSLWGGVSRTISDAGLSINGKVSDLAGGSGVQQYADVSTTSKSFFGLVKKTTNDTQFASMGDDMAKQFGMVFTGIGDTLKAAAVALGRDGQTVGQAVADFVVDIPRLSLKDLKGADLQAAIANAISGASDGIAKAAIAGLDGFQQVGEGYFQTLVRVASGVESARVALDAVGVTTVGYTAVLNKQGDVATEIVRQSITAAESAGGVLSSVGAMIDQFNGSAADLVTAYTALRDVRVTLVAMGVEASALSAAMIQGAGGLDALKSSISSYLSDFYTGAERFNIGMQQIGAELGRLGINTVPATREAFRALVEAQDRSTEAGQRTYGALIAMSGAFADVVGASTAAADALASLTDKLKSVASAALAGVDAAVSAQKDALTSAYQADVAKVDAAIAAAKAQFEATMAEIDAQRAAAKAIYDAQVSAINSARAALDAQAASQTKAYTDATKAVDAERKAAQAAYKSAADQMSAVIKSAGDTVTRLRGLNDSLKSTLSGLHPMGSEAADRARGQAQIASALAVAKASGVLPDADALKTALEAVSKPSEDLFGSFEDYLRDFYRTSLDIRDLSDIAGTQLDGAQTQLDATLAMRDALDAANDANMTRLDGIRDALDAANDLARDQLAAARDRLDGQLAGARTTYDTTLVGLDSAAKAAQAVLDGALAQGEAQKSALKDAYESQLAVLTDILATAKAQLAAALGIDASVKSVAQALADFAKTLGPLAALTGGKAPDAAPSQKNQWVTNGAVSTYSDTAGAVAVKAAGQDNASAAIKGVNGAVTTISEAADFIKSNTVAGNTAVVAEKSAEFGISTPNVDALAGYTPGTFAALSGAKGATIAGFSVDDIRAFVAANANDPLAIYRRAVDAGITSATLDAAMGWPSGKSLAWALANKLPAFAAGGDHAGGLAIVGEQGPELVNMGPARVWNNEQTTAMLRDPGRREAALVSEVQRLRQTVDELRSDLNASTQAIAVNTGKSARLSDRWDTDGLPATRTTT